jgi:ATP-binding cassette subfamily B protein
MANEGEHGGFEDVRESVDGHPMASLLAYARPYWRRLTVGVVASLVTRLARLVPPVVVGVAIDRVIRAPGDPGLLADLGLITSQTISPEATALRMALLERLVVIAAVAYLVRSVTRFTSRYLLQSTAQKIQRDLRNDTYDHMQHLSMDFFADHQTGGMMSILNNDINRLERFLNTEIRQIIRVVATVGGIGAVMFYFSPKLALVALAPVPLIGLSSGKFLTWIEPKYKAIRETVARLNTRLENNIGGAPVIKTFNRHDFEFDRVADQSEAYHDEKVAAIKLRRAFFSSLRLFTGVVFVALLYLGGQMVIAGSLAVGAFATLFLLLRRLYSPMRRIGKTANKYQLSKSSAERVFGILGHDPTVTSPEDPMPVGEIDGRVTFEDVRFGYGDEQISGGQRQRVAIARALLNDPAIIVLDEATSDVDTETEELIQESLTRLTADRTAFVIAHRLSTIEDADRIVVMEDGRISEQGSHDELLTADDAYADLWRLQAGSAPAATGADD